MFYEFHNLDRFFLGSLFFIMEEIIYGRKNTGG